MLYRIYCKKKFEETKYSFYYDSSFYKELAYYSGWNLFGNIASVARIQGNNIILNLFFGPIVNAAYGITSTLQGVLVSFVGNFQMAVNPQIVKSYAAGNPERTIELVNKGAKFSFFAMLLITSPILYDVEFWLKFWLGNVPDYTLSFVFLCLCNTLLDTISNPIMMGIQATGKIRQYQIVVGILVFLNLPVSYIMLLLTNNADIVFWVSIIISCIALYFRLYFLKKIIKFNIAHFVKDVLLKIIGVVVLILVILFGLKFAFQGISDLFAVLLQAAIVVMVNFGAIYFLGITMSERAFIKTIILQKIRKK
jgi:O-antigen/teichoic acid export membrane protein